MQETPASDGATTPAVPTGPGKLVRIDATTGEIDARVPIPSPTLLASDDRSVWVFSDGVASVLVRVDATSLGRPDARDVDVAFAPTAWSLDTAAGALAAAGGSVWLSDNHGELYRLAPGANTVEWANPDVRELGNLAPDRLVGATGSLWMSWFPPGSCCVIRELDLHRVDPATGEVIATIEGATQVVAAGRGFVWAAMNVDPTDALRLVRIDTETYLTTPIGVLGFPWTDLAVAGGAVWASSPEGGAIVRLDPVTGEEVERIRVGGEPHALAAGAGAVWAAIDNDGEVARYDTETGRVETINVGGTPNDLVFAHGSVWVTVVGRTVARRPASGPFLLDLRTGESKALAENLAGGINFAASLDGTKLAYVETDDEGSPQIFTAHVDGTGVRQMTHDPTGATWPAWSPDETMIAYLGNGSGLFVLDVETGESRRITVGASRFAGVQFAPDGSSLVYTGGSNTLPVLLTVPVVGGESTILFGEGRGGMNDAAIGAMSPDGSLLTMMGSEIGGPGAIRFVANVDGTDLRHIPEGRSDPAGTWSPDGNRIVCSNFDRTFILVVDIETGEALRVSEGNAAIWLDRHTLLIET